MFRHLEISAELNNRLQRSKPCDKCATWPSNVFVCTKYVENTILFDFVSLVFTKSKAWRSFSLTEEQIGSTQMMCTSLMVQRLSTTSMRCWERSAMWIASHRNLVSFMKTTLGVLRKTMWIWKCLVKELTQTTSCRDTLATVGWCQPLQP